MSGDIDKHIGRRIYERRCIVNMTQSKLAEAIDVSFQQAQKYENGINRVSASRLWLIAKALDVSPAYFFEGIRE